MILPNKWIEEPDEPGCYAVALDGTLIDLVYMYDKDHMYLLYTQGVTSMHDFIGNIKRQEGWRTSINGQRTMKLVKYDRDIYPDEPPLLWNKLIIPPICFSTDPGPFRIVPE